MSGIGENTVCPSCKKTVIERRFTVLSMNVDKGKCKFCNSQIHGVWN